MSSRCRRSVGCITDTPAPPEVACYAGILSPPGERAGQGVTHRSGQIFQFGGPGDGNRQMVEVYHTIEGGGTADGGNRTLNPGFTKAVLYR